MSTMRAVCIHQFGGPEVLKLEQVLRPSPKEGQVLIRVHSVGINPYETQVRDGEFGLREFPHILGSDCAGVIEAVGSGVTEFKVGDRVFTVGTLTGSYAEYTIAVPDNVVKLTDRLSFAQGASIGTPYFTAYKALFLKTRPKKGDTVLVHGASGAVGIAAVQYSKTLGTRVFGTAGSPAGLNLVKKNGADLVFNHNEEGYLNKIREATEGKGVNVIIEMLSNINLQHDLELLKNKGAVVVVGCRGPLEINPSIIMMYELSVLGVETFNNEGDEWTQVRKGIEEGMISEWVQPVVAKEYTLSEVRQAHTDMRSSKPTLGKLVLDTTN